MGHIPPVWEKRMDPKIVEIFRYLYSEIRGEKDIKLVPSIDGINFSPNHGKVNPTERPWEHLDQSFYNDPYKCIQGSLAFSNTSAGFLCSPKSHLVHHKILKIEGVKSKPFQNCNNWVMIKNENRETVKFEIEKAGGRYQLPIIVPAGSMILWFSSTLHSARGRLRIEENSPVDRWNGWRGVYYLSYRPADEFRENEIENIKRNTNENLSMNHWSMKTFSPFRGLNKGEHENIAIFRADPKSFFDKFDGYQPKHPGAF